MVNNQYYGVWQLSGILELQSPMAIGCGTDNRSDADVILDENDNPFIPATSLVGVLRQLTNNCQEVLENRHLWFNFWGFPPQKDDPQKRQKQSMLKCSDCLLANSDVKLRIRDGIKIDEKTGIVEPRKKYDYEIVERGAQFQLKLEAEYHSENEKLNVERMLVTVADLLRKGLVSVGAKTNNGLGKVKLIVDRWQHYDFNNKNSVVNWLKNKTQDSQPPKVRSYTLIDQDFYMEVLLDIKNSLIIRANPELTNDVQLDDLLPDQVSLKSKSDFVIPGSSWKGAIRNRCLRIINTLTENDQKISKKIIDHLFGKIGEEHRSSVNKEDRAIKGRLKLSESYLPKFIAEVQNRIRIDRFTGSVIDSALFDSMPIFPTLKENTKIDMAKKCVKIEISINNYRDYEVGLLLLVLKDLWTGDLAVGGEKGIGRGVFKGYQATVSVSGKTILIPEDLSISNNEKNILENYVSRLQSELTGEQ